jgi:hypothetical protein
MAQREDQVLQVHSITHALTRQVDQHPSCVRLLDHYAATTIASYACIRMSDSNGNPSEAYWKLFLLDPRKQCGLLMNTQTVEKVMVDLMNKMIEKHEAALLQINDDVAVCKWLMKFKNKWEDEYRDKTSTAYDIAEPVLAVMHEAVLKTERVFETHAPDIASSQVRLCFEQWYKNNEQEVETSLPVQQAVTRFYFRHASLAHYMCLIAGKIWKLQEVCDKPGAFPSVKQQNLLQKQLQDAISNLVQALRKEHWQLPPPQELQLYCMDHKTKRAAQAQAS